MAPPTIIAHKSGFLAAQTLHLSQALAPSPAWRAANDAVATAAEEGDGDGGRRGAGLPARAVDDALYRLNHALAQHARRVYAPQASRLVAEQIEGLFYAEAERAVRGDPAGGDNDEGAAAADDESLRLNVGVDFTTDEAIASLPATWDLHKPREAESHPLEARRYAELSAALSSLSARQQEARERVARLRRMAALLRPFDSSTPTTTTTNTATTAAASPPSSAPSAPTVQENLITRNGEVERELERMRLLLARVAGRVAQLPTSNSSNGKNKNKKNVTGDEGVASAADSTDLESLEREKVDRILDRL
ncbi:kinetochore Sim4 complex subunit Fta4 [Xylaria palmicola]|nr:kinetochore Sim4 complex subunit Fta4 [Xylaria palmicola]